MSVNLYNETFIAACKLILDYKITLQEHLDSPHRWLKGAAILQIKQVDKVLLELKEQYDNSETMKEIENELGIETKAN